MGDEYAELPVDLRAKLRRIADTRTLRAVWEYLRAQRTPLSSADSYIDPLEHDVDPGPILASDERLRMLKYCIVRDEKAERTVRNLAVAFRISKRVALAELIGRYIEERDARRAMTKTQRKVLGPRSSVKDRFTDLLFPETIQYKKCHFIERAEGKEGENGRGTQMTTVDNERDPRQKAKQQFGYWITLGEPLAWMAQCYGYPIIALLPDSLTDKE
jgi:hypothetical protein